MTSTNHKFRPAEWPQGLIKTVVRTLVAAVILAGLSVSATVYAKPAVPEKPDANPKLIDIPAGRFVMGSDTAERNLAYQLDTRAYGSDITRKQGWYDAELGRKVMNVPKYAITTTPITNQQYAAFIRATGHRAPKVDVATWNAYGLIHKYARTKRHQWHGTNPPKGRGDHPVVLISQADAKTYALWLSKKTGKNWHLPSEAQWEKAMRGRQGVYFTWGNVFDAGRLNTADKGPDDTMAVGRFPSGASPYGVLDGAGQVYEWTAGVPGKNRVIVKGGGWDDKGCGVCRPAARHTRPANLKHILIGFRLVVD